MEPLDVSVVIPTFDRPELLGQTLRSVLTQTRPAREVLVVDNGTRGGAAEVVAAFGDRVRYLRTAPLGVQTARNAGIAAATSEWVATLDDDDLYRPTFLEAVAPALADDRVDLVFTDHRKFSGSVGNGRPRTNAESAPAGYWDGVPRPEQGEGWSYVGAFPTERLLRFNAFYPSTMVVRKAFVAKVGFFDPGVRGIKSEDLEFTTRALAAARLAIVWSPLVDYRMHDANTSGDPITQRVGRWRVFERVREKDEHGSPALAAALEVDLPGRRCSVFDLAFRHGDLALLAEVSGRLRPQDWTPRRRLKRAVVQLPAPVREPLRRALAGSRPALRRDRALVADWRTGPSR